MHRPNPADKTFPKKTSSTSEGVISGARCRAAGIMISAHIRTCLEQSVIPLIACDPSCGAVKLDRLPRKDPIGVLAADTM